MRSIQDAYECWEATFAKSGNLSDLKNAVKCTGDYESTRASRIRSVCWKAFLLFENLDKSTWSKTLSDSRSAYGALRDHFLKNIEHPNDVSTTDPLTGDERSPWTTLRQDEELRAEIFQDVERCMPDNWYFHKPGTEAMLLDILFIYCKINPDIGYRQGMHDILAYVLWAVDQDAIDEDKREDGQPEALPESKLFLECLDVRFVEHDTFTLFSVIMQTVKSSYEIGSTSLAAASGNSPIVERSRRITEVYLRQADPELAEHLTAIEIPPQVFLIRWIRLLFNREFSMDDVLDLWDKLFAEGPTLELVDLICVCMLLRIRWQLLETHYTEALTLLLRYPMPQSISAKQHSIVRPSTFVSDAVYLHDNIEHGGGVHLIQKHSGRIPIRWSDSQSSKPKSSWRFKRDTKGDNSRPLSPGISAVKAFQEHGTIEGVLQEAAKGVYSRGEKWGVNKAFRGAMEGLQSSTNFSQPQSDGSRWSLDTGTHVPGPANLISEIKTLEQRSKGLAKLLENTIDELWTQQRQIDKEQNEDSANALSLAIAKIQFVQVYLENPSMPFLTENPDPKSDSVDPQGEDAALSQTTGANAIQAHPQAQDLPKAEEESPQRKEPSFRKSDTTTKPGTISRESGPDLVVTKSRPQQAYFHQPRPSLAQSSFSWMLGEDQRKSSFVSPSPSPSERRAARKKAGYLFGEEKNSVEGKVQRGKLAGESEDEEVINMGTLKGHRPDQ